MWELALKWVSISEGRCLFTWAASGPEPANVSLQPGIGHRFSALMLDVGLLVSCFRLWGRC